VSTGCVFMNRGGATLPNGYKNSSPVARTAQIFEQSTINLTVRDTHSLFREVSPDQRSMGVPVFCCVGPGRSALANAMQKQTAQMCQFGIPHCVERRDSACGYQSSKLEHDTGLWQCAYAMGCFHVLVCSLLRRLVAYVKAVARSFISSEVHVRASVSRRFYWTEMCPWPEDLPAGSTVLLSGKVSKAASLYRHCSCHHDMVSCRQNSSWRQNQGSQQAV
jgi:hypothetical protein